MASKLVEPNAVLPRSDWAAVLQETMIEVFSTMVGVSVHPTAAEPHSATPQLSSIVGIAGALRARCLVRCSQTASHKLASHMLGAAPEDLPSSTTACDALGEICNIVAGSFKAKIGLGATCMLSLPTVVMGRNYTFHSANISEKLELAVSFEGEPIIATLEISK